MLLKVNRTDRIFITGRSGSGKTYLAKTIVRNNQAYDFFVLDVLDNLSELDRLENVARFVFDPLDEKSLNTIIWEGVKIGAFFLIDEMHSFPFHRYKSLRFLILAGRNKGCGWIAISQFPSQVSKTVIGNSNLSFLFANNETNAIRYLTSTYEVSDDELHALREHEFYLAYYSQIKRDLSGKPIKFIL